MIAVIEMKQLLMSLSLMFLFLLPVYCEEIELESDYIYMIDPENNQVLMDQGSNELIYPASMTKMMTLIVALENIDNHSEMLKLDHEVFKGLYEANASLAGFSYNEEVSVKDCLYGLFLPSGAECTRALAIKTAGSEEAFVDLMNQKAKELNMMNTPFVNTTGLHHKDHVTTLQDLSILLRYCLKNEDFMEIFTSKSYVATSGTKHNELKMESTLFKRLSKDNTHYILGGKTGYTNPAGLCLASYASFEGRDVLLITAHAPVSSTPYHLLDAVEAYSYVFEQMHKIELCSQDDSVTEISVRFTLPEQTVQIYPEETLQLTVPNDITPDSLRYEIHLNEDIKAPLTASQNLGTLRIYHDNDLLGMCELEVREDVIQSDLLIFIDQTKTWLSLNWKMLVLSIGVFSAVILFSKMRKS